MNLQQFETLSDKEKAVLLGHKLHLCSLDTQREGQEYHEWLRSAYGIAALKEAMIKLGYALDIYVRNGRTSVVVHDPELPYSEDKSFRKSAKTETEATWKAAALALLGE